VAIDFDTNIRGVRSQVVIPAAPFTICGWVKVNDFPAGNHILMYNGENAASNVHQFALQYRSSNSKWNFNCAAGGLTSRATCIANLTVGQWQHVAAVAVATNDRRCFMDGGNKGTSTTNLTPVFTRTPEFQIAGGEAAWGTQQCDVVMAHWTVWDVSLSDAEVASLATGMSPLNMHPDNITAYWPFNNATDLKDIINGTYDLTLTGTSSAIDDDSIILNRRNIVHG